MPDDLMRYDQLAQSALRGMVREALKRVEKNGLPGEHHFFIAFDTTFPGVDIGARMLQRYPREMTIVLQHQFGNLNVRDDRFEVELSFDNIPEKLVIPFDAIKGFMDPYVQFALQFEAVAVEPASQNKPFESDSDLDKSDTVVSLKDNQIDGPKVVSLDAFRKK